MLPLTLAAVHRLGTSIPVYEIPLVFQRSEGSPYSFQQARPDWDGVVQTTRLTHQETGAKLVAGRENYTILNTQLGGAFDAITVEQASVETFMGPVSGIPSIPEGQPLRYEWRARKLMAEGAIDEMITYRAHFQPIADHLCT